MIIDNDHLQRDRKKGVEEKEGVAWLLTVERAQKESSTVVIQLKKDVSAVTTKACERVRAPSASLEQVKKQIEEHKKGREAAIRELGDFCKEKKCVECERGGFKLCTIVSSVSGIVLPMLSTMCKALSANCKSL